MDEEEIEKLYINRCNPHNFMCSNDFECILTRYVFLAICIFGIAGNSLNLTVLLDRSMRSRANTFLAMLACADICFLIFLLPNSLVNYEFFNDLVFFKYYYSKWKVSVLTLNNWCTEVSLWAVILVCLDRLIGIRNPLYVRGTWGRGRMPILLLTVIAVTGVFTLYGHFEFECRVRRSCNYTQVLSRCIPIYYKEHWFTNSTNDYPQLLIDAVIYSKVTHAIVGVLIPNIILIALNVMLLTSLRHRHKLFNNESSDVKRDSNAFQKTEQRVTITVAAIVTVFTLTNAPSAVYQIPNTLLQASSETTVLSITCSGLVVLGKALNFIVFCLSSKHFRVRLINLAQRKVHKKIGSHLPTCASRIALFKLLTISSTKQQQHSSSTRGPAARRHAGMGMPRRSVTFPRLVLLSNDDDCKLVSVEDLTSYRNGLLTPESVEARYSMNDLDGVTVNVEDDWNYCSERLSVLEPYRRRLSTPSNSYAHDCSGNSGFPTTTRGSVSTTVGSTTATVTRARALSTTPSSVCSKTSIQQPLLNSKKRLHSVAGVHDRNNHHA